MEKSENKKDKKSNIIWKILLVLQLALSIVLITQLLVLPAKYLIAVALLLLVMLALPFGFEFSKGKLKTVGKVLNILLSVILVLGIFGASKMNSFIKSIGSDGLKIDNMLVAVRLSDPADDIYDAKDYTFGVQKTIDKDNTNKMLTEINSVLKDSVEVTEFNNMQDMVNALFSGDIDAIIYNGAFTSIIEEFSPDYLSKVKFIHKYGIKTKLDSEEKVDINKGFNLYISGIDVSGPISMTSRSDVNIIMTVNPKTKQIVLTTTPRDYFVPIPGVSGGVRDKLTHAGIYGVDASIRTLEELYGINISYYARVNFASLIKMVDVLDGVDVYSEYSFNAGGFHFDKGINHLNGKQALAFSRERHSFSSGDNQRGKNQEAVIEAIIQKAMSPAILKDAGRIMESLSDSVQTNMSGKQMKQLINMQLQDNAKWSVESQAVTGFNAKNTCYSSGRMMLYVMNPNMESVNKASANIKAALEK